MTLGFEEAQHRVGVEEVTDLGAVDAGHAAKGREERDGHRASLGGIEARETLEPGS